MGNHYKHQSKDDVFAILKFILQTYFEFEYDSILEAITLQGLPKVNAYCADISLKQTVI